MDYIRYVNIKQGTNSSPRFSNGNTLPLVQRPFGFASFAPQTNSEVNTWYYNPNDRSFEGVRLTHQPSPWIGDHGAMAMLPQIGQPCMSTYSRWSGFDHSQTVLQPHYLKYYLKRSYCTFELTPSEYGACVRLAFERDYERFLSVLPVGGNCSFRFDEAENRLYCSTDQNGGGRDSGKLVSYIVFQFEKGAVSAANTLVEDLKQRTRQQGTQISGENAGIHLSLNVSKFEFKLAVSFISYEQALQNLKNDSTYKNFDELKKQNEDIWNGYLGRIEIKASEDVKKTFYSCLYRTFLYPHRAYEKDKAGKAVHYSPAADAVKEGLRYTDNGFWDTYRTIYPLFSIIAKEELPEMIEGFVADYVDGGWLPRWSAGDAKCCMPSTAIDAVIADAGVKGFLSKELLKVAFEGMEKHAGTPCDNPAYGREGCEDYRKLGYMPFDRHGESVNLTLDAAYFDDCIADVAKLLGYSDKEKKYRESAKNYRLLLDSETGFMRARDSSGAFRSDFDPFSWGRDYTEASAWQTTFAVQHDLLGLAGLYGGKEGLIRKLDEFFAAPPEFRVGGYGREIHEMTEMADKDWGQCAISNQPSFHIPFIYAYLGCPEKTHYHVERICREGFSSDEEGFPGDEDNGSMSAWYLFACMGIYPICPGKPVFTVSQPLIEEVRILGKSLKLSGAECVISYDELMKSLNGEA